VRLRAALEERGKSVWIDLEGIRAAEQFPEALRRAIESSDAFVFVISPDSVRSEFCKLEVDHAIELNKRIVPLALHRVPDDELPDAVGFRNWIPVDNSRFAEGVARLIAAINTDLDWEHQHTHLTVKAIEWDGSGRDKSFDATRVRGRRAKLHARRMAPLRLGLQLHASLSGVAQPRGSVTPV
jgi:hypothetical protein